MEDARYETEAIVSTGMSDYFLLNHEIVRRTIEKDDVITKTGRGSAPSYYTNTLLGPLRPADGDVSRPLHLRRSHAFRLAVRHRYERRQSRGL